MHQCWAHSLLEDLVTRAVPVGQLMAALSPLPASHSTSGSVCKVVAARWPSLPCRLTSCIYGLLFAFAVLIVYARSNTWLAWMMPIPAVVSIACWLWCTLAICRVAGLLNCFGRLCQCCETCISLCGTACIMSCIPSTPDFVSHCMAGLAVDVSALNINWLQPNCKDDNKLYSLVYNNTSGMA